MRLFLLSLLLATPFLSMAADWDGQPNPYRVRIDVQASRAEVEADLWQQSDTLSMYNVMQVPGLANGRASLVEGLRATDATGTSLPLKDLGAATIRCPRARFEAVCGTPAAR